MPREIEKLMVNGPVGPRWRGVLVADGRGIPCALGRSGLAALKREGDGATPVGRYPVRSIYFRPDRVPRPKCGLPVQAIHPRLGWCDAPADPLYNRPVRLPQPMSHERMWRDDGLYDLVVVIGHNDTPPRAGLGSAIFLHAAGAGLPPTEGCVAIPLAALARLVPRLGPDTRIVIGGAPNRSESER